MLLFIAMVSVSTSPIIAKYLNNVPALGISFWRMFFGALILWIFSFFNKNNLKFYNDKKILIAGLLLGIHFALFFRSIKLTTIANATFLGTLAPLFAFIIEKFIFKKKHKRNLLFGLSLAFLGTIILIGNKFDFSSNYTIGNLFAVACSGCLGLAFIITADVRKKLEALIYSRMLFTYAAITLLVFSILTKTSLVGYSNNDYIFLFILGLVPTIMGHGFMYYAAKYISPIIVSSAPMGEPILASIMAWYLFNESIELSIMIGGFITFIGLYILITGKELVK
tara:strand:+ start:4307 stop:5149 length:843 start_codon:yes stop_codon:yes gene_type:complete